MSDRQLAVALRYSKKQEEAPRVLAKGRDSLAERILQLARQHDIPVHQDTDLVEILIRLDVGDLIPPELYKAVAELLAYIYRMNKMAS